MEIIINGVRNYYGSLMVKEENNKYYMKVLCEISNREWREIKKELYYMLIDLNDDN